MRKGKGRTGGEFELMMMEIVTVGVFCPSFFLRGKGGGGE